MVFDVGKMAQSENIYLEKFLEFQECVSVGQQLTGGTFSSLGWSAECPAARAPGGGGQRTGPSGSWPPSEEDSSEVSGTYCQQMGLVAHTILVLGHSHIITRTK